MASAREISPAIKGGASVLLAFAAFGWLLAYLWFALPGQNALGAWNYVITIALLVAPETFMHSWHGYSIPAGAESPETP